MRHRISLGPHAHLPGFGEGAIFHVVQFRPVEVHLEESPIRDQPQRAPLARWHVGLLPVRPALAFERQVRPLTAFNLLQHHVVFQGVRANDVVVVLVLIAPHQACRLIDAS